MTETQQPPAKHPGFGARHPGIHFLWAAPLAIVASLGFFFIAAINVCGVSGCGGGGYGVSRGDPADTAMFVIIGSLIWMLPVGLIPWTKSRAVRATTMLVLSLLIGSVVWVGIS